MHACMLEKSCAGMSMSGEKLELGRGPSSSSLREREREMYCIPCIDKVYLFSPHCVREVQDFWNIFIEAAENTRLIQWKSCGYDRETR